MSKPNSKRLLRRLKSRNIKSKSKKRLIRQYNWALQHYQSNQNIIRIKQLIHQIDMESCKCAKTRCICSCCSCGNPRRYYREKTRQELKNTIKDYENNT